MGNDFGVDGFILCGGKASRLKGVNGILPKCLLKVHGRSVLGHLIHHLGPKLDRITISYHKDRQVFIDTLAPELETNLFRKLNFENDPCQEGTALAVQRHQVMLDKALSVINGDTLYDDYSDIIPPHIATNQIIFSTSFQNVDRAGEVTKSKINNMIEFSKNRDGGLSHKGRVTNGVLSMGSIALSIFRNEKLTVGASLEGALLKLQYDSQISALLHKTDAKFMDIGVPEEFLNAEAYFKRLNKGGDE